jgi:predicted nucleic acid-binding protein
MRYLLDTAFLIDYMRGDATATRRMADLWADAQAIYVNEIVVCELMTGLAPDDVVAGEALLRPLEFIQPGPESALQAGRWRAEARRGGRALSLADALIAAAADAAGATILTRNLRDFSLTPVPVEVY